MKTRKISLADIKGKLSRAEMKNIMAGSGGYACNHCGEPGCVCYNAIECCAGITCVDSTHTCTKVP